MEDTAIQQDQIVKLFEAGSHLGHKTNRVHPKAQKYIYTIEQGVSIIDLTQTYSALEQAKQCVNQLAKENKTLLVVITKKIVSSFVQEICKKNQLPYITIKWPAGLLTNFKTLTKNINTLNQMREEKEKGEWEKFVKHERTALQKKLNKLNKLYGGIATLNKLPDALFVVDIKKEKNAVKEAGEKNIPVIAIVDTNADPAPISYPVVANDDSITSIEYLTTEIISAYAEGKTV